MNLDLHCKKNQKKSPIEKLTGRILKRLGNGCPSEDQKALAKRLFLWPEGKYMFLPRAKLTPSISLCLLMMAKSLSLEEIALLMDVKIKTIETYRQRILSKFHCKTIEQAVYKGLLEEYNALSG